MALPNISILNGQGLGRRANGEDHISGLLFIGGEEYSPTTPLFASSQFNYAAVNTSATCFLNSDNAIDTETTETNYSVTLKGLNQDDFFVTYKSIIGETYQNIINQIGTLINNKTEVHGYKWSSGTLTAPKKYGTLLNTLTVVNTLNANFNVTTFNGGTVDKNGILKYHIDEYFRLNQLGQLWIKSDASTTDYSELYDLQVLAGGKLRQVAIVNLNSNHNRIVELGLIQSKCDLLASAKMPLQVLFASSQTHFSEDLTLLNARNVSVIVSKDTANLGNLQSKQSGKPITAVASFLGIISKTIVNKNGCQPIESNNLAITKEFSTFSFVDETTSKQTSELNDIHDRGFIFVRSFVGLQGAYFSNSNTCISETNDYSTIENNRTMQKVDRTLYLSYLPNLHDSVILEKGGAIDNGSIMYLESVGDIALQEMKRVGEVSDYSVTIDPNQTVASTSTLEVSTAILPSPLVKYIILKNSFTTSI